MRLVSRGEALELAADALNEDSWKISPAALVQAVSRIKNGAAPEAAGISPELFEAYQSRLQQLGMLDFDDLLTQALKLDVAGRRCFIHLLVDEFQDINQVQYDVIRMLAAPQNNLFIVGDDDQSIYKFRGAKPEIMLGFKKDYENVKEILLDVNYRSTKNVVYGAQKVIRKNRNRS